VSLIIGLSSCCELEALFDWNTSMLVMQARSVEISVQTYCDLVVGMGSATFSTALAVTLYHLPLHLQ
jgi:hypothetical protein